MAWVWTAFLAAIAFVFAVFEGFALATGRLTLSRWVWNMSKAWPPFPWLVGLLVGFLSCHFFWVGQGCVIGGFGH
jgi:hypothetical protein